MNLADILPETLADVKARERAIPKGAIVSRLEERTAADAAFDQAWDACKRKVDARDGPTCRACQRRTKKTIRLCRERAEHHHITRRSKEPSLLTDSRNVLDVCHECHEKLTNGTLHIVGTARDMFTAPNGRKYLNADSKNLRFVA